MRTPRANSRRRFSRVEIQAISRANLDIAVDPAYSA
jgi:hypothetical protein